MLKLDAKDKKILSALEKDARMPLSKIAELAGISKQLVDYRIRSLQKRGVITRFSVHVDLTKLGYSTFGVYLRLKNMNDKREKEVMELIRNNPFVKWMIVCTGKWDFAFSLSAKNIMEFNSKLGKLLDAIGDNIDMYETNVVFSIHNFPPIFLEQKETYAPTFNRKEFTEGGSIEKLDPVDVELISALQDDSRQSLVELGQKVHVSADVVRYRMKSLVSRGIITKFSTRVSSKVLEYEWYQLTICLKRLPESEEKKFMEIIRGLPNTSYVVRCIGKWDFEIHILAKNTEEFRKTLMQIRDSMADYIISYDTMMIFDKSKSLTFPAGVADELSGSKT